ncbi:MAG: hypothetical protein ABJB03_00550 [Rhodoglobus sp.]
MPGTTGVAAITNPVSVIAFAGTHVIQCTWSTASTAAGGGLTYDVVVVAGEVLSFGWNRVRPTISNRLQMSIEWRTNVGTISTVAGPTAQVTSATNSDATTWKQENLTAPALATVARVKLLSVAGTGYANWSIASNLQVDALMVNAGATLQPYVDGSRGYLYEWAGVAHASVSTFYTPVITLTPLGDAHPCPRMLVVVDDLPVVVASLSLYRTVGGRQFRIRGAVMIDVAGGYSTLDVEVPLGAQATYRAQMFNSADLELGFTATAAATTDSTQCWIHNPLDPYGAIPISVEVPSAQSLTRRSDGEVFYPQNRVLGVLISGPRRGLAGVDLYFSTDTISDADKFEAMLGGYSDDDQVVPVLCIRIPATLSRLPGTFFGAVLALEQKPVDVHMGGSLIAWQASADEVSPPFPGIIVPLLTRDDIDAAYATRNAIDAAYATRLAEDRDYSLAGTA